MSSKKKRSKSQKKSGSNNKRISSDETKSKKAEEEEKSELSSELVFEDPFGDDFDEEDIVAERLNEIKLDIHDHDEEKEEKQSDSRTPKQPWRPGVDEIPEGEELEYDPSAYVMYHALSTEWPCLSFDIFRDNLGDSRQRFPMTMYAVCGTQADRAENNKVTILKLSELHKTQVKQDSDSDGDDEDDSEEDHLDEDPTIEHLEMPHYGGVNRIRGMPQSPGIVATMSENKAVNIFDCRTALTSMMNKGPRAPMPLKPAYIYRGHKSEGYAIDWSLVQAGRLATGDCSGNIHVWAMGEGSSWTVDPQPYSGHSNSVEELQWSPTEATVYCSGSSDRSVRVWDVRGRTGPQLTLPDAHNEDVNVLSWNKTVTYLLASAADDGTFKVWDLRTFGPAASPLAHFSYHKLPVTSIEWNPHDESMLAVSCADDQLTIWDLSVEADEPPDGVQVEGGGEYPPQLLFIHLGQRNVKELHFHPQIPGLLVSTAEDGLNVFKPAITAASST